MFEKIYKPAFENLITELDFLSTPSLLEVSNIYNLTNDVLPPIPNFIRDKLPGCTAEEKIELLKTDIQYLKYSETPLDFSNIAEIHNFAKKSNFKSVEYIFKFLLTLPGSNAQPERVFSCLNRTLTPLRTAMGQERVSNYITISMNKPFLPTVEQVIDEFIKIAPRKLNIVFKN